MVESWCSVVLVGMAVGGRGAACCRQPMGRRSRFNPCMPGRLGVGRLACGLFIVGSLSCSSLIGSRSCSPRRCSWTRFLLSSRISSEGCGGLPVRCGLCVPTGACPVRDVGSPVVVRRWFVWALPAVSGRCSCPYVASSPSGMLFRGVPGFRMSARVAVVLLVLPWLLRHRLCRPMAGLSHRWTRRVVAVV